MPETGPIDRDVLDRLLADVGDDKELVRSIIATYLDFLPSRYSAVVEAIETGDGRAVANAAHALASSSITIGVRAIFGPARAIEAEGNQGELVEATELLQVIEALLPDVRTALKSW